MRWSSEDGKVAELESYGMPLVSQPEVSTRSTPPSLPRDVVMLFTDGLVEALDSERSMYGFDRVQADFTSHASVAGSAASRLDAVLGSMRESSRMLTSKTRHVVTMVIPDAIDLVVEPALAAEDVMWATDR